MSNKKFIINMAHKKIINGKVRLYADCINNGKKIRMFFEYDEKYESYITYDVIDPFVLMTLEFAMAKKYDIVCKQPMSNTLFYQLTNYFIPLLADNTKTFHKVNIFADVVDVIVDNTLGGVGTGLSCGVDSFHTILKYKDFPVEKYKLTHVFFMNNGSMGVADYKKTQEIFYKLNSEFKQIAEQLNLELVSVNTNMMELYSEIYTHRANNNEGLHIAACLYAVRKLVNIYYIASTVGIEKFKFSDNDVGFFAPFTADVLSTEEIRFYIGDLDCPRRIDKVREISSNEIVMKSLRLNIVGNCGHCAKCIRTQTELWALDKLDDYGDVFDIENFRKHFCRRLGKWISLKKEWEFGYIQEVLEEIKSKNKKIPLRAWAWAFFVYIPGHAVQKGIKNTRVTQWIEKKIQV